MHILLFVTDFVLTNMKPDGASLTVPLKLQQSFPGNYPCGREIERCSSGDVYRTHHLNVGSLELSLRGWADIWMQGVKIVLRGSTSNWNGAVRTTSLMSAGYWLQPLAEMFVMASLHLRGDCATTSLSCCSLSARMKQDRFSSRQTLFGSVHLIGHKRKQSIFHFINSTDFFL